uniref:Uncharacterized protein n=1 Tax=Acrobeloides nanus TaxID=290746 RepID=A0A914CPA5_9BILA
MGAALLFDYWDEKNALYNIYTRTGLFRMILILYLIVFLLRWVDDPNWTNKRPEDINKYGFVVLIAVALESAVALAVVNMP